MHGLVIQLKNGVGDLRAEWLLIKREVQGIKTETLRLQVYQGDLNVSNQI